MTAKIPEGLIVFDKSFISFSDTSKRISLLIFLINSEFFDSNFFVKTTYSNIAPSSNIVFNNLNPSTINLSWAYRSLLLFKDFIFLYVFLLIN